MNKKIFTVLLLTVFMLAQFSMASAATLAGDATITPLPVFSARGQSIQIDWSVTGMSGANPQYVILWSRDSNGVLSCQGELNVNTLTQADGTFVIAPYTFANQDDLEFLIKVDSNNCAGAVLPAVDEPGQAETYIDGQNPSTIIANPPSLQPTYFQNLSTACKTFELWGIGSDNAFKSLVPAAFDPGGYSGFEGWHPSQFGTFAPPAPLGSTYDLLSWVVTFPDTASNLWQFMVEPSDYAGNQYTRYFRSHPIDNGTIWSDELADCQNFTDTSGNMNEVYVRYMAQLELGHGYEDGTFNPDGNLSRAEMAAFIELANGYTGGTLPPAPLSAACTFSDVTASDWFSGWVWQACADGFMAGIGGGLFDPNNLLTRGQVVTVLDNLSLLPRGGYLNFTGNIFNEAWGILFREAAWTDVNIGDYFANGVIHAYGVGVVDETAPNTFSPNQAVTRGEFMKMMYRALSRIDVCLAKTGPSVACCKSANSTGPFC